MAQYLYGLSLVCTARKWAERYRLSVDFLQFSEILPDLAAAVRNPAAHEKSRVRPC